MSCSSETTGYLLSIYTDYNETHQCKTDLKLLLPLTPSSVISENLIINTIIPNYHSMRITSSRVLYYSTVPPLNLLPKTDICAQLRQMKLPRAYALFLKDLSRLIKPTSSSSSKLSIDLIWELMPDVDEHQRLLHENHKYSIQQQQDIQIMNQLIADIWAEIGKN